MYILKTENILKIAITILAVIFLLFIGFMIYTKYQAKLFTGEGEGKLNIGGYSLYLNSQGEGNPTVVFVSGLNCSASDWSIVPQEVSKHTRVVVYDRAGLGNSDNASGERTGDVIVEELHALLNKANIKGPNILVGHSAGGLFIRMYAAKYPKEVAGMVFLDSSHEEQFTRLKQTMTEEEVKTFEDTMKANDEMGIQLSKQNPDFKYPETVNDFLKTLDQAKAINDNIKDNMKDIPITVIAAGITTYPVDLWLELQKDIASLSKDSKFILAEYSSHAIHIDEYEFVTQEILEMVNKAKK